MTPMRHEAEQREELGSWPVPLRLVAACLVWPGTEAGDARIRALAARISDWDEFIGYVNRHRAAWLANGSLRRAGVALPGGAAAKLTELAREISRAGLRLASEAVRLSALLNGAGIPNAVIKGPVVARRAFGEAAVRHASDIDLFISAEQITAAVDALQAAGYAPGDMMPARGSRIERMWRRAYKDFPLHRKGRSSAVELHWRLVSNEHLIAVPFRADNLVDVEIYPGGVVQGLSEADEFAYLCTHGALHYWVRLKWLADIAALVANRPPEEVRALYEHAVRLGAGVATGQALLLASQIFGNTLPEALHIELEKNGAVRRMAALARQAIAQGGTTNYVELPFATFHTAFMRLRLGRGAGFWLRQLEVSLFSPREFMAFGLPDWLLPLQPVLRPFLWFLLQLESRRTGLSSDRVVQRRLRRLAASRM
jgi:hypothetical protein